MCGIAGSLNKDKSPVDRNVIERMSRVLHHRGPDEEGYYYDSFIGLGIQRLKVIDLKTGTQPVHNEDNSVWTVLNGEIYNYRDLRSTLVSKGHKFYTASDSETIVHAYEEWGDRFVEYLNGMFAIAIWDKKRQRLLLVRDRLGIKPLYYYETSKTLLFGSEIKTILTHDNVERDINYNALNNYLYLAYVPAPGTMFKNIMKLLPGHMLTYQNGRSEINKYWDISYEINKLSEHSCLEHLHYLFTESVKSHLISDVPLGLFLSGGIDSSILAFLMDNISGHPISTFSISYEEPSYNESGYARMVADHFQTDHHELILYPNIIEKLEEIIWHMDEPLADPAVLPSILLSKLAKKHVTVVLNGAGGDEIFGGYDRYRRQRFLDTYVKTPELIRQWIHMAIDKIPSERHGLFKTLVGRVKMISEGSAIPLNERYLTWTSVLSADCRNTIFSDHLRRTISNNSGSRGLRFYFEKSDLDNLNTMMYLDTKTYLVDDILTMTDKMSMACGLEVRVPFLNHEIVQFAATIPNKYKIKGGKSKYLLRQYLSKRLPKRIWNRPKQGFMVPISSWLKKKKYYEFTRETLLSRSAVNRGLFNTNGIEKILNHHREGVKDYGGAIWALLNFELWNRKFLDNRF